MTKLEKMTVLMIQTSNSGIAYWRLYNPWVGIHRNGLANAHVLWWNKSLNEIHPWQYEIEDPRYMYRITAEMSQYAQMADVIVIQGVQTPAALNTIYALKDAFPAKPILTEMDDDVTWTPADHPAAQHYTPGSRLVDTAIKQLKVSDGLIVSTPWLKEVYSEYNDNIEVLPNAIDFKVWDRVKKAKKPGVRIGFAGGASHIEDLRMVEGALKNVLRENKDVRLVLVHCVPDFLRDFPGVVGVHDWARIDKYPAFLGKQDFDIGIAPLIHNRFNRCKSNLRWLEYSALGIPTVASKVGHFEQTITHGMDGFLAETPEQFEAYLQRLISDAKLRKRMGANAYNTIRASYNIDGVAHDYIRILRRFAEKGVVNHPPELPATSRHEEAAKLLKKPDDTELLEGHSIGGDL